jgi:ribosomal protein L34E
VYENTPQEIERARKEVTKKINKPYTCRICASIVRDVMQAEEAEAQNA